MLPNLLHPTQGVPQRCPFTSWQNGTRTHTHTRARARRQALEGRADATISIHTSALHFLMWVLGSLTYEREVMGTSIHDTCQHQPLAKPCLGATNVCSAGRVVWEDNFPRQVFSRMGVNCVVLELSPKELRHADARTDSMCRKWKRAGQHLFNPIPEMSCLLPVLGSKFFCCETCRTIRRSPAP